jgi:hypothetical protein
MLSVYVIIYQKYAANIAIIAEKIVFLQPQLRNFRIIKQ